MAELLTRDDVALPYKIEGLNAHGRLVRLGSVVHEILSRHDYPEPVARLLGEALVLTSMLGSTLKFDGRFVLQTKSDGPVSMLVCDVSADGMMRGQATIDHKKLSMYGKNPSQNVLLGRGHIALTVDQGPDMENYQGVVPLDGTLLEAAQHYFEQSEQIETCLTLAAAPVVHSEPHDEGGAPTHTEGQTQVTTWRAGGIILQKTATEGGENGETSSEIMSADDWIRLTALLATTQDDELLSPDLPAETLMYRLFNEDGVRVFEPRHFYFDCTCSRARIENLISTFSESEIQNMLKEDKISVTCEFCNEAYRFDPAQFAQKN